MGVSGFTDVYSRIKSIYEELLIFSFFKEKNNEKLVFYEIKKLVKFDRIFIYDKRIFLRRLIYAKNVCIRG